MNVLISNLKRDGGSTHLSGEVLNVPYMVPMLSARPPITTTQGFVAISRYDHPEE